MKVRIQLVGIIAVACLLIGIAIGWSLLESGTQTADIKWKFGDNELSINLDRDLTDITVMLTKIFSQDFSEKGTKEWLKINQNLYDPTDPDIIKKFSQLEYDDIVSKGLREMSYKREGPWVYQLDTIKIGIPNKTDQPKRGFASVCENGKYFTKRIEIFSLDQTKSIVVQATGRYECPPLLKVADIQLNSHDAEILLGTTNFSKYEQGMALILTQQ